MAEHVWEVLLDERRVAILENTMRDLHRLAIEGFLALPRRGVEVGGILLGEAQGGEPRVEGFEEAPCEHRYGPSYSLSLEDRRQLAALLAGRQTRKPPVNGFFRSFASREPVIEEADEAFVREHFGAGDFLFLLLQPRSAEECTVTVRLFRDGRLLPDAGVPAAADRAPLPMPAPEAARPQEAEPRSLPPSHRSREKAEEADAVPLPLFMRRGPSRQIDSNSAERPPWWALAAIFFGSAALAAGGYQMWNIAQTPRWTDLQLNARPSGGQLQVTWDGRGASALHAARGLLAVNGGAMQRDIELNPAAIRAGEYRLPAPKGDLALRLILYARGAGVAGDSLRVATLAAPALSTPPSAAAAHSANEADREAAPEPPEPAGSAVAVPPTIVHEVQPGVPEGIRSRIVGRIVIPVQVEINERGRVVRALAGDKTANSVHRYLAEQAQKAAWEWRFLPARTRTGARVAATKTIDFIFTR